MNPILLQTRPIRRNRRRRPIRRVTLATLATALTLSAALVASSALDAELAERRDLSIETVAQRAAAARAAARAAAARAAADACLLEFIGGTTSYVDEPDLEIASPAIRARAFLKLD